MFEFRYKISLSIVHPNVEPAEVSVMLAMEPDLSRRAGEQITFKSGKALERKSPLSHWLANLYADKEFHSDVDPLSERLLQIVKKLESSRHFLHKLISEGGEIELRVGWFSNSRNSTGILEPELLRLCGVLGIRILLDVYGPSDSSIASAS